jgi:hypothetical protein
MHSTSPLTQALIDQTGWDMLCSLEQYQATSADAALFCRFLAEEYSHDDLLFFLFFRSVAAQVRHEARARGRAELNCTPVVAGTALLQSHSRLPHTFCPALL